ncbi:acyl-CoA dehydrogenase family protein [Seohaeicola nanhaiensis]|uniref:Acyl-CoA dehydrogenase family protein n=1 Tax=Seohaeicola nanhaiensis TaxID=1387282 RepID=A0ABV9KLD4_9RHOB
MDFSLSLEQSMLCDSLNAWLADSYDMASWRKLTASWPPEPSDTWQGLADLGVTGLIIPDSYGGIGMGAMDLHLVAEALGRHLVIDPFLSTAVLGAELIIRLGDEAQKQAMLPAIAEGRLRLAVAHAEKTARFDPFRSTTVATATDDGLRLRGEKMVVMDAPLADRFLVVAQEQGAPVVAIVNRDAPGLTLNTYRLVDDRAGADMIFDDVPAERLGAATADARKAIDAAFDLAAVFVCAEAVGAMRAALRLTIEHVKSRRQFGTEIGNFQALRHRIAEMQSELSAAEAMSLGAAAGLSEGKQDRMRAVSAAKVQCIQSSRYVGRNAVQLHGGMGVSQEVAVGQYFKRLIACEPMFGDIGHHQARFASLSGRAA